MKKRLTLWMALLMALTCCLTPLGALAEPAVSNEVTVTPPEPVIVPSEAEPNLTLSVSLTPELVAPGSTTVCVLSLSNTGGPASGKTVFCYLPAGFVPTNPSAVDYDPDTNLVKWTPSTIGANETVSLAIDVLVPANVEAGSTHAFNATLDGKSASAVATVINTTLALGMHSNVKKAEPGDAVLYTITLENKGNVDAAGLTLTNQVPSGMTIDPASITGGGTYANGVITWTLGLAAGQTATLKFLGVIPYSAHEGDVYVNIATVDGLSASASVTVYESEPILSIAKKVNNRTPAPGTTVKYTITVKNTGAADAYDVDVIDELPEDLEINRNSITHDGSYSSHSHEINWTVDVPAYDSVTLTFKGYVPDWMEDGDRLVNRARIHGVGSAKATMVVTEDAVPKTGYDDVIPAAWDAAPKAESAPPPRTAAAPAEQPAADAATDAPEIPMPQVQEAFQELYAKNEDLVGWLKVADQVDLPVAQADNNDFYMIRNFDKADDEAGALFLDERNHLYPSDQHLMIYGHNMKSGAMFGRLHEYRDLSYLKANPVFTFQSVYDLEPTPYVVVAALDASMDEGNKDYLKIRRPNFDDEADALAYIDSLKGFSYFDIPVAWDETDRMLSLVTCSYLQDNGRFLIVGRPLREDETVESVTAQMAEAVAHA